MQPGQVPEDQISPATQVGGAISPRGESTLKKKKGKMASDEQNITPIPGAPKGSSRKRGGANGATNGGDSGPPTKSSKSKRKRDKKAAVEYNDTASANGYGSAQPEGPSQFELLKKAVEMNQEADDAEKQNPLSGEASAENSSDEEEDDTNSVLTLNRSALDHPHVLLLPIVLIPTILLVVICGIELKDTNTLYQKASSHDSSDLAILVQKFSDALSHEIWTAGQLQLFATVPANGKTLKVSPPINDYQFASARYEYTQAIAATTDRLSDLLLLYTAQADEIKERTGGSNLSPDGLNIASLEKLRDSVLKGQHVDITLHQYYKVQRNILLFVSRAHYRRIALQDSGIDALRLMCLKQQAASLKLLGRLIAGPRTSHDVVQMKTLEELQLAWRLIGQYDVCLYSLAAPGLDGDFDIVNIQIPADHSDVAMSTLINQNVNLASGFSWNTSAATELRQLQKLKNTEATATRVELLRRVSEKPQAPQMTALLAVSVISIFIAFIAAVFNSIFAGTYALDLKQQQSFNKEVRSLERCIKRIKGFVEHVQALDIQWMVRYAKRLGAKATKIRTQPEENILYQATSHLKDVALYLPPTVTHPPKDVPKARLTKTGLFIQPHLVPSRDIVGIRTSLNAFHGQFAAGGSKQKGMQHQMTRFLNLLQELGTKENPHAFINVFGDHALLWLNVIDSMDLPCLAAFRVVVNLITETTQGGVAAPNVVICAGDGLVGHVSNSAANHLDVVNSSFPLVTSFTVFGPVADELYLLDSICQLHEVDFVSNDKVTKGYFNERQIAKNDVFSETDAAESSDSSLTFTPVELSRFPPQTLIPKTTAVNMDDGNNPFVAPGKVPEENITYSPTYEFNADICDIHDYSAQLNDEYFIAPAFRVMNNIPEEDKKRNSEWVSIFDHFFDAVKNPNTGNINVAMERLEQFTTTYGTSPTTNRLLRVLKDGNMGKRMGADLIGIKTDRLYAGIA